MDENTSLPLGRVLVVDDESQLVAILCEMITGLGYEATGFLSGKEALGALLENSYDILLTDIIMPEMDGVELARRIRSVRAKFPMVRFSSLGRREAGI